MKPQKQLTNGVLGGGGITALIAWVWGMTYPEQPMPPEVAAVLASTLGGIVAYLTQWLPRPGDE